MIAQTARKPIHAGLDPFAGTVPPDLREKQWALHDAIVAELRALSERDPRPRPPVSVQDWLDRFLASGYVPRINEQGQLALCVPESMSEQDYSRIAAYAEEHEQELRALISPPAPIASEQVNEIVSDRSARATQGPRPLPIRNGVLSDTALYYVRAGKPVKQDITRAPGNVGDILQMCLDYRLDAIWVIARSRLSARATETFINAARPIWHVGKHAASYERGLCKSLLAWKEPIYRSEQETGRAVCVNYCEHNSDWNLEQETRPATILATVAYLEDVLALPIRYSAGSVGKEIIKRENSAARKTWIQKIDIKQIAALAQVQVHDLNWKRPLTDQEQALSHLLAYDKTMQYPSSCTGVKVGAGMPVLSERPTFDMKSPRAGIWHCTISGSSPFDGVTLPHPTDGKETGWFYTYTVKLLYELGYQVEIDQAWIWQESHTILRPFAETMWQARALLDDKIGQVDTTRYTNARARSLAVDAIKYIAKKGLGWLDMGDSDMPDPDWYIRPDWWGLIIDNARYQMFWRIRSYLDQGYAPVGIHADCLYYVANTPDHASALPHFMEKKNPRTKQWEPNQYRLGGYKPHYRTPITTQEVAALFADPSLKMDQINAAIHKIDRAHSAQESTNNG